MNLFFHSTNESIIFKTECIVILECFQILFKINTMFWKKNKTPDFICKYEENSMENNNIERKILEINDIRTGNGHKIELCQQLWNEMTTISYGNDIRQSNDGRMMNEYIALD